MEISLGLRDCRACRFFLSFFAALFLVLPVDVHADVCEPQCRAGRGICVSGQCFCHSPWGGDGCNSVVAGAPQVPAARDAGLTLPALALAEGEAETNTNTERGGFAEGEIAVQQPPIMQPAEAGIAVQQQPVRYGVEQEPLEAAPEFMQAGPNDAGVAQSGSLPLAFVPPSAVGQLDAAKRPSFLAHSPAEPQPSSSATAVGGFVEPVYSVVGLSNPGFNANIKNQPGNSPVHRLAKSDDEAIVRIADESALKKRNALRDARAQLRQDLEQINARANALKLNGDPVAAAVLRDLSPVRGDIQFIGSQAKSWAIDTTTCIAAPLSAQAAVLAFLLVFAAIDHCSKSTVDGQMHQASWACGCCLHVSRCFTNLQGHTIAFFLVYLLVMDGTWAFMCQNGTAAEYLSTIGQYAFLAFAVFGLVFLFLSEIYSRCAERVERFEKLGSNVTHLVDLLDVKYGRQLKSQLRKQGQNARQARDWVADKVDDVGDAVGIGECSSSDDVSCWNGCRAPAPKNSKQRV